jgi:hypothetical protein
MRRFAITRVELDDIRFVAIDTVARDERHAGGARGCFCRHAGPRRREARRARRLRAGTRADAVSLDARRDTELRDLCHARQRGGRGPCERERRVRLLSLSAVRASSRRVATTEASLWDAAKWRTKLTGAGDGHAAVRPTSGVGASRHAQSLRIAATPCSSGVEPSLASPSSAESSIFARHALDCSRSADSSSSADTQLMMRLILSPRHSKRDSSFAQGSPQPARRKLQNDVPRALAALTTQRAAPRSGIRQQFCCSALLKALSFSAQTRRLVAPSASADSPETSSSIETTGAAFLDAERWYCGTSARSGLPRRVLR